jgi:tRNA-binding protein
MGTAGDSDEIGFDDFLKVDIRVGTIVKVEDYPEARKPAYKLWVDFGGRLGVNRTSRSVAS